MTTDGIQATEVDVLYELGTLRFIERSWRQFHGANVANVAEHSFRVAWIAAALAKQEGANVAEAMMMALVHDVSELRTNDVSLLHRQYTTRDERRAVEDIFSHSSLCEAVTALWQDVEDGSSLLAQIVKDADRLDSIMEIMEQKGRWPFAEKADVQTMAAAGQFRTRAGRQLWRHVQKADPHSWYAAIYAQLSQTYIAQPKT